MQDAEQSRLVIRDHLRELPEPAAPLLYYREQSGQTRGAQACYSLKSRTFLLTREVRLKDHNYRTPGIDLTVHRESGSAVAGRGTSYRYGEHHYFPDEQGLPEQMIEITKFFRDD